MTVTTNATDRAPASAATPHSRERWRQESVVARIVAVVAAVAAAVAGCEPTGTAVVDPLLSAAFAAVVTLAAARSRRWPWFAPVAVAIVVARGWALAPALAAAATALVGATTRRRSRLWGALTGGLAIQALLRLPDVGFHGATALVAAAAVLPVLVSAYRTCRRNERRTVLRVALGLTAAVVLIGVAYGALLLTVATDLDRAATESRTALEATRRGDTTTAQDRFARAADAFARADARINGWWTAPVEAIPVLAQHARALGSAAGEGRQLAETAEETVIAGDFTEIRSIGGQFDLARIASVEDPLSRSAASIVTARDGIASNDSPWLLGPVVDQLAQLDSELAQADAEADLALDAVRLAPDLLGGTAPRSYLVVFVTPAELRGSGGFIGSYAELSAVDGRLRLERSGSVRELLDAAPPDGPILTGLEDYRRRYDRYGVGDFRDLTLSPHFPFVGEAAAQVYPQVGGVEVDGVISLDPIALAALLEITGPVRVGGFGDISLDAGNAADFLLKDNYLLFPDSDAQNDALAELVEITFDELTTGDLPGPRKVSQVLGPVTRERRVQLWSPIDDENALFARVGATAAFPEPRVDRDFLTIASQNAGPNKIDAYQRRSIDYQVRIDSEGRVRATAAITVANDAPLDAGLPDYVLGNDDGDPRGTSRMLMSVYTPHGLDAARLDGEAIGMDSLSEAGFRVYTTTLVVPAGGSVTLELDLEGVLDVSDGYVLDMAPQPTVTSDRLEGRIDLDGTTTRIAPFAMIGETDVSAGG